MFQATVAIGKNFLRTNVEQFLNLNTPPQGSPQTQGKPRIFSRHTEPAIVPYRKALNLSESAKDGTP